MAGDSDLLHGTLDILVLKTLSGGARHGYAIARAIEEVMAKNPAQLAEYRAGKDKLFGFFVGQVMKATGGKANPAQLNELLRSKLRG